MTAPAQPPPPSLAAALVRYTGARAGVVGAVAGLLVLAGVPLIIAVLVGLVVALPLSAVLLRGLRARLDEALAAASARRRAERAALRARLRGDAGPSDPEPAEHQSAEPGRPGPGSGDEPVERQPDSGRG